MTTASPTINSARRRDTATWLPCTWVDPGPKQGELVANCCPMPLDALAAITRTAWDRRARSVTAASKVGRSTRSSVVRRAWVATVTARSSRSSGRGWRIRSVARCDVAGDVGPDLILEGGEPGEAEPRREPDDRGAARRGLPRELATVPNATDWGSDRTTSATRRSAGEERGPVLADKSLRSPSSGRIVPM